MQLINSVYKAIFKKKKPAILNRETRKPIDLYKYCAIWTQTKRTCKQSRCTRQSEKKRDGIEKDTGETCSATRILFSTETPTRRRQRARLNFLHCHRVADVDNRSFGLRRVRTRETEKKTRERKKSLCAFLYTFVTSLSGKIKALRRDSCIKTLHRGRMRIFFFPSLRSFTAINLTVDLENTIDYYYWVVCRVVETVRTKSLMYFLLILLWSSDFVNGWTRCFTMRAASTITNCFRGTYAEDRIFSKISPDFKSNETNIQH